MPERSKFPGPPQLEFHSSTGLEERRPLSMRKTPPAQRILTQIPPFKL